jgi:hypothetical protein
MDQEQLEAKKLHDLLNAPKVPGDLAEKLKANLEKQILEVDQAASEPQRRRKLWYALAASLTLAVAVAWQIKIEPDLVSLAYAHTQEEANLVGAIDGGYEPWFETVGLGIPTDASSISLSKNCALGKQQAKHLRFELANKGTINLFLYQDGEDLLNPKQADGSIDGQFWLSVSLRDDIHLLALYDNKVSEVEVTHIIQSMFEERSNKEQSIKNHALKEPLA